MSNMFMGAAPLADAELTQTELDTRIALDPDMVENLADANNALFVQGDSAGTVALVGQWSKAEALFVAEDGIGYVTFHGRAGSGKDVALHVQEDIVVTA